MDSVTSGSGSWSEPSYCKRLLDLRAMLCNANRVAKGPDLLTLFAEESQLSHYLQMFISKYPGEFNSTADPAYLTAEVAGVNSASRVVEEVELVEWRFRRKSKNVMSLMRKFRTTRKRSSLMRQSDT